jgi:hypothetical protein
MSAGERWAFDTREEPVDDAASALRERARRIGRAASTDVPISDALALLFDAGADPAARRAVLMRHDLPLEAVIRATRVPEPGVRAFAVGLARTPVEVVVAAARDRAWQVRSEAAVHPGCPADVLTLLARDRDAMVRRAALAQPAIPAIALIDVLTTGGSRLDAEVAAQNASLHIEANVEMLMRANQFGAAALLRHETLPAELVARFAEPDHVTRVRHRAVRLGQCPVETLGRAARTDVSDDVRSAAAAHPGCPPDALAVAARDSSPDVRRAAALHPHCPVASVDLLLGDIDESVRLRAARHPLASPSALARTVRCDENAKVRRAALRNEACPTEVLDEACADPALVLVAAQHPSCTPDALFVALVTIRDLPRDDATPSSGPDAEAPRRGQVRTVAAAARKRLAPRAWDWLAGHPLEALHPDDLQRLLTRHLPRAAADSRSGVRTAVARHPDVDDATLTRLASDADPQVRAEVSVRILDVALGAGPRRR